MGWALEGERQLTVEVPKTDALTTDIVCESGTSLKKVTLDMIKVVTIEADPMTGLKEIGDPAKAPKERTYIVPLAAANDQNPTPVTVEAKLDRHLNESELPAGWTLEGGIGGQKLVRRIARMNRAGPFVTNITFTGNGVDAGVKTTINVLKVDLIPNYDQDDKIDETDRKKLAAGQSFRFWINDDDDNGFEGYDIQGSSAPNYADTHIDGERDLVDFFPVWLDLHDVLAVLPASDYSYWLKQEDSALNGCQTWMKAQAVEQDDKPDAYLKSLNWANQHNNATVGRITSSGLSLAEEFLDAVVNEGKYGIVLLEGRCATTKPLVLEIRQKSDSQVVYSTMMPLSISAVDNMFRYLNLRPLLGDNRRACTSHNGDSMTGNPPNRPDSECNDNHVVFIHGFNETPNESLGNICETFKRLYWSGSKAKYTGVTWFGDKTTSLAPPAMHYHWDVTNAFVTATTFAQYINWVSSKGDAANIIAFSLGNMVASSAIQDHGATPSRYFMLHAAMAREAYDSLQYDVDMRHIYWRDYTNTLYASTWYSLFPMNDGRHGLSWGGRFSSVVGPQVRDKTTNESIPTPVPTSTAQPMKPNSPVTTTNVGVPVDAQRVPTIPELPTSIGYKPIAAVNQRDVLLPILSVVSNAALSVDRILKSKNYKNIKQFNRTVWLESEDKAQSTVWRIFPYRTNAAVGGIQAIVFQNESRTQKDPAYSFQIEFYADTGCLRQFWWDDSHEVLSVQTTGPFSVDYGRNLGGNMDLVMRWDQQGNLVSSNVYNRSNFGRVIGGTP